MKRLLFNFDIRKPDDKICKNPYAILSLCVLIVSAYLCLVNLDYAALWHDEAPTALIGKNLLEQGDITGWDGRNLVGGTNGRTLNEELRDVLPPLMYVFSAAGISIFGPNEIGARVVHALIGILSLGFFYLLLHQHLARNPRLIFFIFLLVAWSPQLLLYFRQARYYAFMSFAIISGFYIYERYWRTKKPVYLATLTLILALSFFNHYVGGVVTILSLAIWHLLFRARETTRKQWLAFLSCGFIVAALGLAYLICVAGVIGGDRSGFSAFSGLPVRGEYQGTIPLFPLRIWVYMRDLFTADWISWPVFLWFAGMLLFMGKRYRNPLTRYLRRSERSKHGKFLLQNTTDNDLQVATAGKIVLMGILFALFSAMLSVQPVWLYPFTDLRYYMGALPLLLTMKGVFAEWTWRKSKTAGIAVVAVLLFTSAGAAPFNMTNILTREQTLGPHFFQFVREIHRPYRDSIREVSDYLLKHAKQDDLVYVSGFGNREALMVTIGRHVQFCCMLNEKSPLPSAKIEALNAPLYVKKNSPEWIVVFGKLQNRYWQRIKVKYTLAAKLDVYRYPTQRPELNLHAFTPLPPKYGVHILQRKKP